jgi:TolB protein
VVAFVSDRAGSDDVYLLELESGEVIQLTQASGEDRDPAFAPDGRTLAYRSNVEGGWAFYQIDLLTGTHTSLDGDKTAPTAYQGHLTWNPGDQASYAYESYQEGVLNLYVHTKAGETHVLTRHPEGGYGPAWHPSTGRIAFTSWRAGQQDLYLIEADGSHLSRLTDDPADQEAPAWHPDGQHLVYVRWQDGDADLWELDLATGTTNRLTGSPYPDRSPAYAPDGTLFWTRYAPGEPFEAHDPYRAGQWQLWSRSAEGVERPVPLPIPDMDVYSPAVGYAVWPQELAPTLVEREPTPTRRAGELVDLVEMDIEVAGNQALLHGDLEAPYQAWRDEVVAQCGYDVLGRVSDMFRPLGYSGHPYGHLSWHRTGRTLDLLFEWHDPPDGPNRLLVVRDDLGPQTYWRLYLLCREQDGSMGEPLTVAPWVFWFDLDRSKEPSAYAAGGKPGAVPAGYYVDLTRLAKRHGWHRIASYEEEDFDWRWDSLGREFWHYQRTDGLTWWEAMSEIYAPEDLEALYSWTVCVDELGLDPAWVQAKGIPSPTPSPTAPDAQ